MEPKKIRSSAGPEAPIKAAIKRFLEERKWLVVVTHGNQFQSGLPDLWCAHVNHGQRWIEVKYAGKYSLTDAQLRMFPKMAEKNISIYIMALYSPGIEEIEQEYKNLWLPPNYHRYIGYSQGKH